jgi:hypothetical protein
LQAMVAIATVSLSLGLIILWASVCIIYLSTIYSYMISSRVNAHAMVGAIAGGALGSLFYGLMHFHSYMPLAALLPTFASIGVFFGAMIGLTIHCISTLIRVIITK